MMLTTMCSPFVNALASWSSFLWNTNHAKTINSRAENLSVVQIQMNTAKLLASGN